MTLRFGRLSFARSFRSRLFAPIIVLMIVMVTVSTVQGSGLSTHFHMSDLSVDHIDSDLHPELYQLLKHDRPQVYRVGSVFPDGMYAIEGAEHLAEAAHWPPFHNASMDYFMANYPQPWDEHAEQLMAFLLGIVSHGVSDEAWHFGDTAFLNVCEQMDGQSHSLVEVGVDIFVQVEQRPGLENYDWFLPVTDLVQIYHAMGHSDADAATITAGFRLQVLMTFLEDALGFLIYFPMRQALPWGQANYMDYYDGGVLSNAELVADAVEAIWPLAEGQAAARPAPALPGGHDHESPMAQLAQQLLAEGLVDVPMRPAPNGALYFGRPVIRNWQAVAQRVQAAANGLGE